jgi:hypothetical protein
MPPSIQNVLGSSIPLPAVILIVAQAIAMTWWASGEFRHIGNRLTALEIVDETRRNHEARLIVIEQSRIRLEEDITEIKLLLRERKSLLMDQSKGVRP